jgi:long-chain acyl-CoA synthetase
VRGSAVREISIPPLVPFPTEGNLTNIIAERAWLEPQRVLLARAVPDGWQNVTAREFDSQVRAVAKGLIAAGIQAGDRVCLMSKTRYEWTLFDFAIWYAGGVTVPIYETSSAEQVEWILQDSGATGIVIENDAHGALVDQVRSSTPGLMHVWRIDGGAVRHLTEGGIGVADDEVTARRASLTPDSTATLIYTSGTTGKPKGCELTHGAILFEVGNVVNSAKDLFMGEDASTLLFLPVAHVFGRIIQIGCLYSAATLAHCPDVVQLLPDLASFKPKFLLSVPRVFEKVYNGAQAKAEAGGKGHIFQKAADVAITYSEAIDKGSIPIGLRLKHGVFDKLVYTKLRATLGGRVRHCVSGGAALGTRLGHFYRGVGVNVMEGYGLTETSAGATLNFTGAFRIGSVGRPVPGTAIRIADDGEVLIKGGIVMRGYWRNPDATREAIDSDGWFHSGDLGKLDDDGFLYIVGRKKEILVTAAGKNVAPAVIEDRIRAHPLISQCVVVGDARPFVAALITLDAEFVPTWAAANGKSGMSLDDLANDADLLAEIQIAVNEGNKAVSQAESVRKFSVLSTDFTIANDYMTPSMKVKRALVTKDFAQEIDALYN